MTTSTIGTTGQGLPRCNTGMPNDPLEVVNEAIFIHIQRSIIRHRPHSIEALL
jgi:hypothetical protein